MEEGCLIPSDPAFWDNFYGQASSEGSSSQDPFEWYLSFDLARQCFESFLSAELLVLQVGCGTSTLAQELLQAGLARHVLSIDSCAPAIRRMQRAATQQRAPRKKQQQRRGRRRGGTGDPRTIGGISLDIAGSATELEPNGASYWLMDACKLSFPDSSFDAVVDKGTLDAMLSIEDEEASQCWKMMQEINRVLKPNGVYLVISGHPKDWVMRVFEKSGQWMTDQGGIESRPLQVPLGTDGPNEKQEGGKEYFSTCTFWALRKNTLEPAEERAIPSAG